MSLKSLTATGTKVWLDGVEPDEVVKNHNWGITGATSNPAIVSKIIEHGHFDARIREFCIEESQAGQGIRVATAVSAKRLHRLDSVGKTRGYAAAAARPDAR